MELERKKAESDALFLSIGEGAIVTDEQGRVAQVNQACLDMLGFTKKELVGQWYPKIIIAEDENGTTIPNLERPITRVFLEGRPVSARVYYRRKDGTRIIVALTVSPVMLDGRPRGAIEVFRNITHEVELEKAKDEFISLASHQLRTPATAVKQYAAMLLQGYAGDLTPSQGKMAETIYECNERQLTIVNDLLRVAQVDAGKVKLRPETVDIGETIGHIIEDLASKFAIRQQTVRYARPKAPHRITVDPQLIRMVVENIVDNASKYTPDGKRIAIGVKANQTHVAIHITDQGVGIRTEDLPYLFQKFSRIPNPLSNSVEGTGLGLYWAKKIVDLHGGTIKVSSQPGEGTTFVIHIPFMPATPQITL
ncbi:MAG TPA: ATP-binding protein [Candidatus Saccharimonadales bacterium]|nr:ATP-binding protein [Candidatus Saccharimonadales bacterium]